MTSADLDTGVREQAYKLWEEAGRPEGRDLEIWLKAETIIRDATSKTAKTNKAAVKAEAAAKPVKAKKAPTAAPGAKTAAKPKRSAKAMAATA